MTHRFSFANRQDKLKTPKSLRDLLRTCCTAALEAEGFPYPAEIDITFTDNREIHDINSSERGIDRETDVLSFPMLEFDVPGDFSKVIKDPSGRVLLGNIVLSLEKAKSQAEEYGHSFERETAFLTVHSILHLMGYDHMEPESEREMFEKQEQILQNLGITR
ncbi:MAG: rRNA maturation RNase YbeY [Bacillota bacterium]|nr:rRNA maturation RNase YbeY [Bacillota bacterium]